MKKPHEQTWNTRQTNHGPIIDCDTHPEGDAVCMVYAPRSLGGELLTLAESDANEDRPLPWHDTATCDVPSCKGPMVPAGQMANGHGGPTGTRIACCACGHGRIGTRADVEKTHRAHRALELYEAGEIHHDRGCTRCNGPLPLDRFRLCVACVAKDNAERQASLFAGAS